jgi:hypothetical protein
VRVKGFTSGVYRGVRPTGVVKCTDFGLKTPPPPLEGYLAGKSRQFMNLHPGCGAKILKANLLRAKYLFCCSCAEYFVSNYKFEESLYSGKARFTSYFHYRRLTVTYTPRESPRLVRVL